MTQNPHEVRSPLEGYDIQCDTLIIGAGACGLVATLAAHEQGQSVLVVERDVIPRCLLYTSPSPRDLSTSRMPSSA